MVILFWKFSVTYPIYKLSKIMKFIKIKDHAFENFNTNLLKLYLFDFIILLVNQLLQLLDFIF